jgi:hypothetical protein
MASISDLFKIIVGLEYRFVTVNSSDNTVS